MEQHSQLLTLAEVAEMLGLEQRRLRVLAKRGDVGGALLLPDGEVRFDAAAMRRWLERRTVAPQGGVHV